MSYSFVSSIMPLNLFKCLRKKNSIKNNMKCNNYICNIYIYNAIRAIGIICVVLIVTLLMLSMLFYSNRKETEPSTYVGKLNIRT